MKTLARNRSARGFSLLEVLVAIVILSVGLLALAALQLTLIRASNDTKAQSTAMSLAKEKIETLGSYQTMGGTSSTCISPAAGSTNTCYRAITTQNSPAETINGVGGVNYTRSTVVTRYVWSTAGSFVTAGITNVMLDSGVKAACATCLPGKEFKRVAVTVAWTDAGGATRNVQVEDVIPGLAPGDSLTVNSTSTFGAPRQAIAIIPNQATVQGVIPIAIGNGSDTAATNPRPVIVSQGQNNTTIETRFDIYTYAALNGSSATAQSRIETAVVGCKCTRSSGTHAAFRPTYWNGFKYTSPVTSNTMPVSVQATGVTQSNLCTACCRDHHDPVGQTAPLYDPRRSAHNHYLNSDLVNAVTTGAYHEACRLIRVDGVFRVAAEPYNDHYGLLATPSVANSTRVSCAGNPCTATESAAAFPATGTGSVTELYQTFVLNYLKDRFVDHTNYNTVTDPSTISGYSALQTPATAHIENTTSPQYMHSRGLYIDYLHTDAIAAIASAKATCLAAGCTASETQTAVLKLLPFTSINTTEVAGPGWSKTNAKINVSKLDDLYASINASLPAAGSASFNSGTPGDTVTASTQMQRTSAGLAVLDPGTEIIFPSTELANNIMSDTQPYQITGPITPPAESFTIAWSGTNFLTTALAANPWNANFGNGTGTPAQKPCTYNSTNPPNHTCTTTSAIGAFTLGGLTYIQVSNYNRSSAKQVFNGCSTTVNDKTDMPYIRNFDVVSTTPAATTNVATNANKATETTMVSINPVTANSTVTINMSAGNYMCPSNWSVFINDNSTATERNSSTYPSGSCTSGSPSTRKPIWSTTYGACPVNFPIP